MPAITQYVNGFLFSEDKQRVVLVKKNRPDWQAGKFNGVGGHVESGEFHRTAMRREFKEETGLLVKNWNPFLIISNRVWEVHFFFSVGPVDKCKTVTDEEVVVVPVNNLPVNIISNLKWIIPLALDPQMCEYDNVEGGTRVYGTYPTGV